MSMMLLALGTLVKSKCCASQKRSTMYSQKVLFKDVKNIKSDGSVLAETSFHVVLHVAKVALVGSVD